MDTHLLRHLRLTKSSILLQLQTSVPLQNQDFEDLEGKEKKVSHSSLLITRGVKWEGRVKRRGLIRDNADVRRGRQGEQRDVSTLCAWHEHRAVQEYMKHKQRRTRHFKDGCWMGHSGTRSSQYINRRPSVNQLLRGVGELLGG